MRTKESSSVSVRSFRLSGLLAVSVALLLCACAGPGRYAAVTGYAQGGTYSVKFNTSGVRVPRAEIASAIDSILTLIDTTLSGYNKASQLSRFNAGETIVPNQLFSDIYAFSHDIWEETGGCVDVAAGPLFDIWGFGFSNDSLPSDDKVRETMETCGMGRLPGFIPAGVPLDLSARLNFNAVAQGYTCDMVADYLKSLGVIDMLVDIGEIYCAGLNPSGREWSIGVDRPVDGNETPGADLDGVWLSGGQSCGIVTSGNYRKFYVRDGRKYSHTIDPRSGYPVDDSLLSATIVAPTAAAADAYATYCMVLGFDGARAFIESRPDLEGYLIYDLDGTMTEWASPGFTLR